MIALLGEFKLVRILTILFLLLLLVIGVSFSSLNASTVEINYYFGLIDITLAWALVLAVVVGVGLGILSCLGMIFKLKAQGMALKKNIRSMESEISSLKALSTKEA